MAKIFAFVIGDFSVHGYTLKYTVKNLSCQGYRIGRYLFEIFIHAILKSRDFVKGDDVIIKNTINYSNDLVNLFVIGVLNVGVTP